MVDIPISDDHRQALAQIQHRLEWLQSEQTRLQIEAQYVTRQHQQMQAGLVAFLQHAYGIDASHTAFTLDTERGVISVPEDEARETAETAEATETTE